MTTSKLTVNGMTCGGCVASVTRVLKATPGVSECEVDLAGKSATVTFDPTVTSVDVLVERIDNAGFEATPAV
ncbi:MAG TPA: heavy metal-associated domain-containing protein [Candidatus Eisenbacteria bacterium]